MATRFYLPVSGSPPFTWTPTSGWAGFRVGMTTYPAVRTKSNTALTGIQDTNPAYTMQTCYGCWVSETLQNNVTITGTVSAVVKVLEGNAKDNAHLGLVVRVVSYDGSVVRGTLISYTGTTTTEWPTSTAATRILSALTLGSVDALSGDRIVIELGALYNSATGSAVNTMTIGDPSGAADFALTAGLTTNLCPWVELSQTLTFGIPTIPATVTAVPIAATLSAPAPRRVQQTDKFSGPVQISSSLAFPANKDVRVGPIVDLNEGDWGSPALDLLTNGTAKGTTSVTFANNGAYQKVAQSFTVDLDYNLYPWVLNTYIYHNYVTNDTRVDLCTDNDGEPSSTSLMYFILANGTAGSDTQLTQLEYYSGRKQTPIQLQRGKRYWIVFSRVYATNQYARVWPADSKTHSAEKFMTYNGATWSELANRELCLDFDSINGNIPFALLRNGSNEISWWVSNDGGRHWAEHTSGGTSNGRIAISSLGVFGVPWQGHNAKDQTDGVFAGTILFPKADLVFDEISMTYTGSPSNGDLGEVTPIPTWSFEAPAAGGPHKVYGMWEDNSYMQWVVQYTAETVSGQPRQRLRLRNINYDALSFVMDSATSQADHHYYAGSWVERYEGAGGDQLWVTWYNPASTALQIRSVVPNSLQSNLQTIDTIANTVRPTHPFICYKWEVNDSDDIRVCLPYFDGTNIKVARAQWNWILTPTWTKDTVAAEVPESTNCNMGFVATTDGETWDLFWVTDDQTQLKHSRMSSWGGGWSTPDVWLTSTQLGGTITAVSGGPIYHTMESIGILVEANGQVWFDRYDGNAREGIVDTYNHPVAWSMALVAPGVSAQNNGPQTGDVTATLSTMTIAAPLPTAKGKGARAVGASSLGLAAAAPAVNGKGARTVGTSSLAIQAPAPTVKVTATVAVGASTLSLGAPVPARSTESSIAVPVGSVSIAAPAPPSVYDVPAASVVHDPEDPSWRDAFVSVTPTSATVSIDVEAVSGAPECDWAFRFDLALNAYAEAKGALTPGLPFVYEFWLKASTTVDGTLAWVGDEDGSTLAELGVSSGEHLIVLRVYNQSSWTIDSSVPFVAGEWHQYSLEWHPGATDPYWALYQDGVCLAIAHESEYGSFAEPRYYYVSAWSSAAPLTVWYDPPQIHYGTKTRAGRDSRTTVPPLGLQVETIAATSARGKAGVSGTAGSLAIAAPLPAVSAESAISVGPSSLALEGTSPDVTTATAASVEPGPGSLAIQGSAASISGKAAVAGAASSLALQAPAPTVTVKVELAVGASSLELGAPVPATDTAEAAPVGTLSIEAELPALSGDASIALAAGSLELAGPPPAVSVLVGASAPAGVLTLLAPAPGVSGRASVQVGPGALAVSAPSPGLSSEQMVASPSGQLALESAAPSCSARGSLAAVPGALALGAPAPEVLGQTTAEVAVPGSTLAIGSSAPAPGGDASLDAPAGSLGLGAPLPAASGKASVGASATLGIEAPAPAVQGGGSALVEAPVGTLGLAAPLPATRGKAAVGASTSTLVLVAPSPSVQGEVLAAVAATPSTLALGAPAPALSGKASLGAGASLAIGAPVPGLRVAEPAAAGSLSLQAPIPAVSAESLGGVVAPASSLALGALAPTIQAAATVAVPASTLAVGAPTPGLPARVAASASLALQAPSPSVSARASVAVAPGSLALGGPAPATGAQSSASVDAPSGNVGLESVAPAVSASASVALATGSIGLVAPAPQVCGSAAVLAAAGSLGLGALGPKPRVSVYAVPGNLAFGSTAEVSATASVVVGPGSLEIEAPLPGIWEAVPAEVLAAAGQLALEASAPSVASGASVRPGPAIIRAESPLPAIFAVAHQVIWPPTGTLGVDAPTPWPRGRKRRVLSPGGVGTAAGLAAPAAGASVEVAQGGGSLTRPTGGGETKSTGAGGKPWRMG